MRGGDWTGRGRGQTGWEGAGLVGEGGGLAGEGARLMGEGAGLVWEGTRLAREGAGLAGEGPEFRSATILSSKKLTQRSS